MRSGRSRITAVAVAAVLSVLGALWIAAPRPSQRDLQFSSGVKPCPEGSVPGHVICVPRD